jgi:hypothetical protein
MEILISALIGLALMELYAWLDPFAKWLVKQVAKKLPADLQADFVEQFTADLDALPHSVAKVFFAIRDGTLSANSIYDAAYREAFTSVADKFDTMQKKMSYTEACLEQARAAFKLEWNPLLKFVTTVDESLHTMRERQRENDVEAKVAIENFESVSAPIIEYFSATEATFEQTITAIETRLIRIIEPYAKVREAVAKLRDRLQDPKPLDASDEKLIEHAAKVCQELTNASISTVAPSPNFPQRPTDLTAQLQAASDAAEAASQAIIRCRRK